MIIRVGALIALAIFTIGVGTPRPVAASTQSVVPSTLYAGQRLIEGTPCCASPGSSLVSRSGEFWLELVGWRTTNGRHHVGLEVGQDGGFLAGTIWRGPAGVSAPHGYLVLRHNGNLVLASASGRRIWGSGTAGSGNDDRLVMKDNGGLILYTADGRAVWQAGTHREMLSEGSTLRPGQFLRNAFDDHGHPLDLDMRRDGDLVLTRDHTLLWASNTLVPGAYLAMRTDGNAIIRGPAGRVLWTSRTAGTAGHDFIHALIDVRSFGQFEVDVSPGINGGPPYRTVFASANHPGERELTHPQRRFRAMTSGSSLSGGQRLVSHTGYQFVVRSTGNLVVLSPTRRMLWQSHTAGHPGAVLSLRHRGNLVLHLGATVIWSAHIPYATANFVMQDDGNAVVHAIDGPAVWSTHTAGG